MRLLSFSCLMCLFLISSAKATEIERDPSTNVLGLGVLVSSSPYKGDDSEVFPVPLVSWNWKDFYVAGTQAGYKLNPSDKYELHAILNYRFMGYEGSDSTALNGMEDRDSTLDGGFQVAYHLEDWGGLRLKASIVHDLLGVYEGFESAIAVSRPIKGSFFMLEPAIGLKYQSEDLVDYYYGVRSSEVVSGRAEYAPDSAVNPYASLQFYVGLSPKWVIAGQVGIDVLSDEVKDSPIVDEDYTATAVLGVARLF